MARPDEEPCVSGRCAPPCCGTEPHGTESHRSILSKKLYVKTSTDMLAPIE